MQIVEYENKYLEDVKDLLVELEEYIVSIDKDHLDQVHPEYREKMAVLDLEEVNKNSGKCYLAVENNKAIGLIVAEISKAPTKIIDELVEKQKKIKISRKDEIE